MDDQRKEIAWLADKKATIAAQLASHSKDLVSASKVLEHFNSKGIPVGIATSSPENFCRELTKISFLKHVSYVAWRGRYKRGKPYPDCLQTVFTELDIPRDADVIYVGDSDDDRQTASNANDDPTIHYKVHFVQYDPASKYPAITYSIRDHRQLAAVAETIERDRQVKISAVAFDLDDTLISGPHLWAWRIAAWASDLSLPDGWEEMQRGVSNDQAVRRFFPEDT